MFVFSVLTNIHLNMKQVLDTIICSIVTEHHTKRIKSFL